MTPLLIAHRVARSYVAGHGHCWARVQVLASLSLLVREGERVLVTGAPGAGKTTLLHCLTGLRRLDAGSVTWRATAGVPYRLCASPADLVRQPSVFALVDLPAAPDEALPWLHALAAAGPRASWLAFSRSRGELDSLADRTLELRHGVLHSRGTTSPRARRVAELLPA